MGNSKISFQEKRVLKQALIHGNLEDLGILNDSDQTLAKEKVTALGYIAFDLKWMPTHYKMIGKWNPESLKDNFLCDGWNIRVDDLNLYAVESLMGVHYLAIGKHILELQQLLTYCAVDTDLTRKCCLAEHDGQEGMDRTDCLPTPQSCCHGNLWPLSVPMETLLGQFTLFPFRISIAQSHGLPAAQSMQTIFQSFLMIATDNHQRHPVMRTRMVDMQKGTERTIRNMKAVDRAAAGFMCKDIVDMGRLMWIKERGLEARLVKYVPTNISPANRLLAARQ
ncbi:hypothetical protein Cgig2_019341 [Carnegiea gigantea]|uniref:tRNA:m(4)X modification enzyme TRM13 n=1 Tax=Carnegiea gigantea TaxID=171969 RepID=A0A9Q1KPC2_9CARY|nr:hypothetical protein Cgig2_019341 [Carnegiea gigantea]